MIMKKKTTNSFFYFSFLVFFSSVIYFFSVSSFVLAQLPSSVAQNQFNVSLRQGDGSNDVLALQQILNTDRDTQVAVSGPGSKGSETPYFGPATKDAVVRFQNKYSSEILIPSGLAQGNGFVGFLTRKKLNSLALMAVNASNSSDTPDLTVSTVDSNVAYFKNIFKNSPNSLVIAKASGISGLYGSMLVIYGSGFTDTDNTVHFGDSNTILHVPGIEGVKLSFVVPATIPLGKYAIWITNQNGTSNKNLFFIIIDKNTVQPTISSISPVSGPVGTLITVMGSGFSKENNELLSPYGSIEGLTSSDGKTISVKFTYPNFEKIQQLKNEGKKINDLSLPIPIGIINNNGASQEDIHFTLTVKKQ